MLNVNPLNFTSGVSNYKKANKPIVQGLTSDVFVKTSNNVSFKGINKNSFVDWAEQTDFISKQLPEILANPKNKIGSGFSHSAYTIPGCDDYILRTPNYSQSIDYDFSKAVLKDTEDRNLKVNVGQKVADIEVPLEYGMTSVIEVLKKQTGKSLGVPPSKAVFVEETGELRPGQLPYEAKERKEYYADTIHQAAQLPMEAYTKLIDDVIDAANAGYTFDHLNSNNLLIDTKNGSINLIDMDRSKRDANLGNLLYALTNVDYFATFSSAYDKTPMSNEQIGQAIGDTIQIIDKFTSAMKEKGLKFKKDECSYEFFNLINSIPFSFFCKNGDYNAKWEKLAQMGLAEI